MMLKDKPEVTKSNEHWPIEKGIYSISGIKKYMRSKGYTNDMTDQALYTINKDKRSLEFVNIYNRKYKQNFPYFFLDLTDEEVKNIKKSYES